jgi:hypothetical protein
MWVVACPREADNLEADNLIDGLIPSSRVSGFLPVRFEITFNPD